MRKLRVTSLLAIASLLLAAGARATTEADAATNVRADDAPSLEAVDHIPALGRMHSWHAIDRDSLIIWATPFDPYLVRLARPSHDLRFAQTIGVTEFGGRVHSRFDSIYVGGLNYRISEIYRLSREDAKALY